MNFRIIALILATGLISTLPFTKTGLFSAESIPVVSVIENSDPAHDGSDVILRDSLYDEGASGNFMPGDTSFARVSYSHDCMKIKRNGETLGGARDANLLPGDILETCSKHFAIIDFYPGGSMILFPASKAVLDQDGSQLTLNGAEILFENDQTKSSFPEVVRCFDESTYHNSGTVPMSFGIHCRGESGMILTTKIGSMWWSCQGSPCEILAGEGLMGRITTANFSSITLPDRPRMVTAYVVPKWSASDGPETDAPDTTNKDAGYTATIVWNPVPMADQYLVHIFEQNDGKIHHSLTLHHRSEIAAEITSPGRYVARVMAIDYYGVTGDWSDPINFIADPRSDAYPDNEANSSQGAHSDPKHGESTTSVYPDSRQL